MRISFTAYHRVEYFSESLASWNRVRGIDDCERVVFLEPSPYADLMIAAAREVSPKTLVTQNPERNGVLTNPWVAMDSAFAHGSDFAILAEDDIIVSTDILEYFLWAQWYFQEDLEVLAVCAFDSHLETVEQFGAGDVTKQRWFSPLVWGTWSDRWSEKLRDTWDHDYTHNGWDWHIRHGVMQEDMFCVFPRLSRSTHIGQYDGTHMQPSEFAQTQAGSFVEDRVSTLYSCVGYLDFWGGGLSQDLPPLDPNPPMHLTPGHFQKPPPLEGSGPNYPPRKAIVGGQSFDYDRQIGT